MRWIQLQDAVGQANGFGVVALLQNLLHGAVEHFNGFFLLPHGKVQFRQAYLYAQVVGLGFQQLAQEQRGLRLAPRLQLHFGELQIEGPRLAQDSLLYVKFRQPFQRAAFLGSKFGDFLVDGDGFGGEAVVQKNLGQTFKIFQGLEGLPLPDEKISQGHQGDLILGLILDNLLVFEDGLRHLPLLKILRRRVEVLGLVISHLQLLIPLSRLEKLKSDNGRFAAAFFPASPGRHTAAQ